MIAWWLYFLSWMTLFIVEKWRWKCVWWVDVFPKGKFCENVVCDGVPFMVGLFRTGLVHDEGPVKVVPVQAQVLGNQWLQNAWLELVGPRPVKPFWNKTT